MRNKPERKLRNYPEEEKTGNFQRKYYKKPMSPVAHRYQMLEDEETGWGKNINQLMGVYRKQHDGSFCLDDIRKSDVTKLAHYPKTTFRVGPLTLTKPIEGMEEGQYCLFNWRFTFRDKINPCEIAVDESKPIVFISPVGFMSAVMKAEEQMQQANADVEPAQQGDDNAERQTDVCVLIYDLLHEADKYCEKTVDAQFYLTDKYLSFQHTGKPLSAETILELCGLGTEHLNEHDDIAYHCRGLCEFLLANNHTIIVSNGFTVRFDNINSKLKAVWLDKTQLSREIKISLSRNKRFTETIILPFDGNDSGLQTNYKVGLQCVFDEVQNIAFFANIGKVSIKIKGGKIKTFDRKDWVVSKEYKTFVPKDKRQRQTDKKETAIMFACYHKGNVLIGEEESPVYSLIPTTSSFGFPFLMQLDVNINKTNYTINHHDAWNKAYAEIAGRLFAKWITDLTQKAEFTPESIYSIVPKFDDCIAWHPEEQTFIKLFHKGFKDIILSETDGKQRQRSPYPNGKARQYKPQAKVEARSKEDAKAQTGGKLYVVDTNVFVNCPNIISKMGKDDTVILSAKVVDELDNLKYKLEDKDLRNVQKALKNINVAIDNGNVRMEMSDTRLLPRDFDRHNPDNNILSVVLRHKKESPTLLTSDNGLQIKAKGIGINVIGLKEFLAEKRK